MAAGKFFVRDLALQQVRRELATFDQEFSDPSDSTSYLGTPVYSSLTFEFGNYRTLSGDLISYPNLVLNTVLMSVSNSKNVVTTALQGREGTIKEYVSAGDYVINIQGKLVSETKNQYPIEDVETLKTIIE